MKLILASQSASRRAMLEAAGIAHDACPSSVDEDLIKAAMEGASPESLAQALADAKALDVSGQHPGRLVLGGDSVASVNGQCFGKPRDRQEAADHLRIFSGQTLNLSSAISFARDGDILYRHVETAALQVRPLSDAFIETYLACEWPAISGCAGAFRMEAMGVQLFDRIEGSHFTILGMPLLAVLEVLRKEGMITA